MMTMFLDRAEHPVSIALREERDERVRASAAKLEAFRVEPYRMPLYNASASCSKCGYNLVDTKLVKNTGGIGWFGPSAFVRLTPDAPLDGAVMRRTCMRCQNEHYERPLDASNVAVSLTKGVIW